VNFAYAPVNLSAAGGSPPYVWWIIPGLPSGLGVSGGTVQGTPTGPSGASNFTVQVHDAAGHVASAAASIMINPALTANGNACSKFCNVEQGCQICGTFGSQAGGTAPYTYSSTGPLPGGTSLSGLSLAGGFPQVYRNPNGTPFTATVTDALGATAAVNGVFNVFAHIFVADANLGAKLGIGSSWSLPYSGGLGMPTVALSGGTPPPGTTFSVSAASPSIVITMPAQRRVGSYKFALTITDQALCGPAAGQNCSVQPTIVITVA
jgi:hypothetical protein